jgi:hypothetical protein
MRNKNSKQHQSFRRTEPEKSFYGGTIVGESAIKTLAEIGPKIVHQYDIWNAGPWKASEFYVDIWWPHQVENKKRQGKWLLYLEQPPVLDGDGNCSLPADVTDVLNLRSKRETERIIAPQTERDVHGKLRTFVEMVSKQREVFPFLSNFFEMYSYLWCESVNKNLSQHSDPGVTV